MYIYIYTYIHIFGLFHNGFLQLKSPRQLSDEPIYRHIAKQLSDWADIPTHRQAAKRHPASISPGFLQKSYKSLPGRPEAKNPDRLLYLKFFNYVFQYHTFSNGNPHKSPPRRPEPKNAHRLLYLDRFNDVFLPPDLPRNFLPNPPSKPIYIYVYINIYTYIYIYISTCRPLCI